MPQDDSLRSVDNRITRRAALQLGAGAGVAVAAAPYLASIERGAVDLSRLETAAAQNLDWPVPPIVTRAQWGANEALRKGGQVYDSVVQKLIVHHTGTPNEVTNYAGLCRSIMANEVAGEYIDIAYNWLIDPNGKIYEGRWARNYGPGEPHTGEKSRANVRGGHAGSHNTKTIGIALMGNYELIKPPAKMIDGLVTLLAWKCARWGLDPRGSSIYNASNGTSKNLPNISGHRNVNSTACPGSYVDKMMPDIRNKVAARLNGAGYWIASSAGPVVARGGVPAAGGIYGPVAAIAGHPSGRMYWLASPDGQVFPFAGAKNFGGMQGKRLNAPIIGMASTKSGNGYWLVARDGGIFSFGDARFYGSTGDRRLNAPILGMLPTSTGKGYYLYAEDGGVFTFGDAKFMGSTGNIRLNQPIVSMARKPGGDGYWLVARDGGVFAFGKAKFRGSGANSGSRSPCVGMLQTSTGEGYILLRQDGDVEAYGDAPNFGGANGKIPRATALGIAGKLKPLN